LGSLRTKPWRLGTGSIVGFFLTRTNPGVVVKCESGKQETSNHNVRLFIYAVGCLTAKARGGRNSRSGGGSVELQGACNHNKKKRVLTRGNCTWSRMGRGKAVAANK